ncbi:gluconate 2-dehydrogenase subunit 3 family protein [Jannaschia aquimarina]|uniref:Gluconate 2-dehydrogenase subunit 3 n=1 Tax=Jannaschia aquimarina TaxID=935700 RepID=A0A0D1EJB0_9RHOB|nr:gluconate 2-dehydrogenase subunit 3 family protein [Jannaschia aquimarina]KIT17066.1 Gluconate 2-dehydrogenase subunit 3 precursor [Jannaschia aquimarina]SNS82651.1 gluconate 2-dehydrogenase gamma chain [Jannaschia aquimarina]
MRDHLTTLEARPSRRDLLAGAAALSATAAYSAALAQGVGDLAALPHTAGGYLFFTDAEATAVEAMVDRLIPAGGVGPGAIEAGVPTFLDRALRAGYGLGEGQYLEGPFQAGTPEQGYQLPLEPHQLYRVALADIADWAQAVHGAPFAELPPATQDDALRLMQSGDMALANLPAALFFGTFWFDVRTAYFSDPIHGGNRDMAAWRMVGFPGAYTDLRPYLSADTAIEIEPVSLAQVLNLEER